MPACRRPNGGRRRGILVISPIAVAPAALAVGGPAWPPPPLHRAWQLGLWSYREASSKGGLLSVFLWAGPGAAGLGASRGAQTRARGREAGSSRPCTWHLRWGGHSHGTPAACALAQPQRAPLLCPLPSAKAGGPSILHLLLEWASTIEQRSNIKTWFRASKRDICAGQKKSTGRLSSAEFAHVVYVIHMCESRGAESVR